ncbi:hypothetical protein UUU_43890 [Klebsiella pneumoniae subsp. pneumoniae DSM 30104 = JCM 1662 = NBRC 14940]|nr:hypothetical protein UUU_43890 [Klebsiella pneumoniae subsp. pneumoniae DSM 30104 = JCM 1662 = NBRC 14940]
MRNIVRSCYPRHPISFYFVISAALEREQRISNPSFIKPRKYPHVNYCEIASANE